MPMPDNHNAAMFSRRAFHRGALAAAAALAAGILPSSSRAEPVASADGSPDHRRPPAGRFIDMHVHLRPKRHRNGPLSAEDMLRWMDRHDVARAVVLPIVSTEALPHPISSDWVLEATKAHRDRLIPFCDVDPLGPLAKDGKGCRAVLRRFIDAGARGLGEHKFPGPINDPRRIELFGAATELGLPILIHMDAKYNTDRPGLPGLAAVLEAIPGGVLLGHAPGWWNALADGTIDRLMDKYPGLHGDLSAGSGHRAIARNLEFGRAFLARRADRLCFGTDHGANSREVPHFAFYDQLKLPKDVQSRIFRDNARRILKLD